MPLTLRGVSHRYGTAMPWVVHDVDLEVGDGESVALMGPSGSGKTTLLSILGLLTHPAEGEVLLDGEAISNSRSASELRTTQFSWVFQTANALLRRTALDNASLQLLARGALPEVARRTAIVELDRVGCWAPRLAARAVAFRRRTATGMHRAGAGRGAALDPG